MIVAMSLLLKNLARQVVRRVAAHPKSKELAAQAAQQAAHEIKQIASDKDPAFAAGRSVRRLMNALQGPKDGKPDQ